MAKSRRIPHLRFSGGHLRRGRLLLLLAMTAAVLALLVWAIWFSPVQWLGSETTARLTIAHGANGTVIARQLSEAGLIRSATAFRILGKLTGSAGAMQAGVYDFSAKESAWSILERLRQGDYVDLSVTVTIPEGYTVKQIAAVLEERGICGAADFLKYLKTAPLPYEWLAEQTKSVPVARRFEGLLFPDSYQLLPGTTPAEVVSVMSARFRQVAEELFPQAVLEGGQTGDTPIKMNLYQLVTMASIVEREAVVEDERAVIAGVFYNRLKINQALQSCATVQYILEKVKPILSTADTLIDSPYNTYQNTGLTPGPIAAPGLPSLRAALQPEATDCYYFFAPSDGSGTHVFSKTFAEHNAAIRASTNK